MKEEDIRKLLQELGDVISLKDILKLGQELQAIPASKNFSNLMKWIDTKSNDIENLKKLFKFLKIGLLQIENPQLDPVIYKTIEEEFIIAANKNLRMFNQISLTYMKRLDNKFPIEGIIQTLLIFNDAKDEIKRLSTSLNYQKFQIKFLELFEQLIINDEEGRFLAYFFDWTLKFGYLIEAYLKEMLCMKLMIKNLLEDKTYEYLFKKTPAIGKILTFLGSDKIISKIRNAIFHSEFFFEYQINWDKRIITFKKGRDKYELSIKEFIDLFFLTIRLVFTFDFALINVHFFKINGGNEEVLEYIKLTFKKSIAPYLPV